MKHVMLAGIVYRVPASSRKSYAAETRSMDADWRFVRGDSKGAEQDSFDDSTWQKVDAPHDWSIEGPFDENARHAARARSCRRGSDGIASISRCRLSLKASAVYVDFDGVMANSDVWINGHFVGRRPYGYSPFRYDLTDHVKFGDDKPERPGGPRG